VFAAHGATSSRARLGVAFERSFAAGGFTLVPYGSINAVHEFDGGYGYAVNGGLAGTTRTDGTSAMLELGLGARKGGLSLTGSVEWTDGGAQQRVLGGQLSVRYGW
jgi:outer membrane autotransporter protein